MALVRWRPFEDLVSMQDEINRVFDDAFLHSSPRSRILRGWYPAVDLMENETEFKLVAELPGMTREDVKISLTDSVLTLRGEKKTEKQEEKQNWHHVERSYGSFERSFQLTAPVDNTKISAKFKDGVLTVILPKSEESRPRDIRIEG